MNKTDAAEKVVRQALKLPRDARLQLVAKLLESLDETSGDDLTEVEAAWKTEVERRIDDVEAGREETVPYEAVMQRLWPKR